MTGSITVLQKDETDQRKIVFAINQIAGWANTNGATVSGAVRYDTAQSLPDPQDAQARSNIYAAPFDALAYNGIQINGSMEVSQELGTSGTSLTNTFKYVCDGWQAQEIGAQTVNVAVQTGAGIAPSGFLSRLAMSPTVANPSPAAGDISCFFQRIEGYRISRLAFGTVNASSVSIGFWIYSVARTGTCSGSLRNSAANRSYTFSFPINSINTWEYKTVTIPGDTAGTWAGDNTTGLLLTISLLVGTTYATAPNVWTAGNFYGVPGSTNFCTSTSDTILLTGVVMLPGIELPSASRSPFIMRPYNEELILSRRYYERIGMTVVTTNPPYSNTGWYRASKRASPTLTLITGSANGATVGTVAYAPLEGMRQIGVATTAADTEWSVDARL